MEHERTRVDFGINNFVKDMLAIKGRDFIIKEPTNY